jgi:hypothetical protein
MGTILERLDLPDGAWADLRDPAKTPERLRRPVRQAAIAMQRFVTPTPDVVVSAEPTEVAESDVQSAFGAPPIEALVGETTVVDENAETTYPSDEELAAVDHYDDVVMLAVVTAWSFGDVTLDVIGELPGDAYDALLLRIRELNQPSQAAEGEEDSLASDPSAP